MTPSEAAARITDRLVADRLPYALGGALALAAWGVPVDEGTTARLMVFAGDDELVRLLDALEEATAAVDRPAARRDLARNGRFTAALDGVSIDVAIAYHPVHEEMERRRVPLVGRDDKQRWYLSAEDLALSQVVAGDLSDLDRLFALRGDKLDGGYVRDWLRQIIGPADPRHAQLAALLARSPSP
jgi:hypothetical protein